MTRNGGGSVFQNRAIISHLVQVERQRVSFQKRHKRSEKNEYQPKPNKEEVTFSRDAESFYFVLKISSRHSRILQMY